MRGAGRQFRGSLTEHRASRSDLAARMDYDPRVATDLDPTTRILKWRFLAVGGVLLLAALIGTAGFHLVEEWPLFDSFYMALMTLTTVGYGEVHPLSFYGRLFASFVMLVGVATVFISFAILGDTLLRLQLADYFGDDGELACLRASLDITSCAAPAASAAASSSNCSRVERAWSSSITIQNE